MGIVIADMRAGNGADVQPGTERYPDMVTPEVAPADEGASA